MSILTDIWHGVRTTMVGLKITVPYITKKPVTLQYPHQRLELPDRARNRLYVNMDDCIGCDQCARACPVNCIDIETVKAVGNDSPGVTSDGKKKALWVTVFDIDIAKCCYCGLCTFPCPTECIIMTDVFEFAEQERNNLIYSYITLTPEEIVEKERMARAAEVASKSATKSAAPASTKSAAAKPISTPSPVPSGPLSDEDKARKIAELQAKMAEAKARRESGAEPPNAATLQGSASAAEPAVASTAVEEPAASVPVVAAAPSAAADDAEKAARIAAMKEKIEAAKRERGL